MINTTVATLSRCSSMAIKKSSSEKYMDEKSSNNSLLLSNLTNLKNTNMSRSTPNLKLSGHSSSSPYDDTALWRKDQKLYNTIRKDFLKFENPHTKRFSEEPNGELIYSSKGKDVVSKDHTQPTARSCNLASFLLATQDLFWHVLEPQLTIKEKFEYMIDNVLTQTERDKLFKEGLSLHELSKIANRSFNKFQCDWKSTSYSTPDISLERFQSLLSQEKRCVINFGSSFLYGLEGNGGHFTCLDKMKIDENGHVFAHLIECANYKYPDDPWIPLSELYQAMSRPGTDGMQRGFIILEKIE